MLKLEDKSLFKLENDEENDYLMSYENNKINLKQIKKDSVKINGLRNLIEASKEESIWIYPKIIEVK